MLRAEIDATLKKKSCKKYAVGFFCSGASEIVYTLLSKIIAGYVVITSINIRKTCFKGAFLKVFCSRGSGFHYHSNNIMHFLIQINSWQGFGTGKRCCQYIGRSWKHSRYVEKPRAGTWASASLSEPPKSDGNLDKIKLVGLETQAWTLPRHLQVLETIKKNGKVLKGFKDLS